MHEPSPTSPAAPVLPGEEVPTQLPPETTPGAPYREPPAETEDEEPAPGPRESARGQRLMVVSFVPPVTIAG